MEAECGAGCSSTTGCGASWLAAAVHSRWSDGILYHGCVPCVLLGTLWILSAWCRRRELLRNAGPAGSQARCLAPAQATKVGRGGGNELWGQGALGVSPAPLPAWEQHRPHGWPWDCVQNGGQRAGSLAVIVPVRGVREHSEENLESILHLWHGAPWRCTGCGGGSSLATRHARPATGAAAGAAAACRSPKLPAMRALLPFYPRMHAEGGDMEVIFVTDGPSDACVPLLERLMARSPGGSDGRRRRRILFSGCASRCSQKVHKCVRGVACGAADRSVCGPCGAPFAAVRRTPSSERQSGLRAELMCRAPGPASQHSALHAARRLHAMLLCSISLPFSVHTRSLLSGIRATRPGTEFVLCLDDDVLLPAGILADIIPEFAADPRAGMATGYPFDIPSPAAGLLDYAALSYHLPLVIGFSISRHTSFVWGGFMLFRAAELLSEEFGLIQVRVELAWGC